MGKHFRCFFFLIGILTVDKLCLGISGDPIQLDIEPLKIRPEATDRNRLDKSLQRMKKKREKREPKESRPGIFKKQTEKLKQAANIHRPYKFMLSTSFNIPWLTTSGDRKNYTIDPSFHILSLHRIQQTLNPDKFQFFLGSRTAAFSGSGTFESISGRYSFLYLGPVFAWGKFTRENINDEKTGSDKSRHDMNKTKDSQKENSKQTANDPVQQKEQKLDWGIMDEFFAVCLGISAQARFSRNDAKGIEPSDDLNATKSLVLDTPGLWLELRKSYIYYGSVGIDYTAGIQLGKGKTFVWMGIGVSGWH